MAWRVRVPLTDLRREPSAAAPSFQMRDTLQESQLLFGEAVNIVERQGKWAQVEALEQKRFSPQKQWHSYPGWVLQDDLIETVDDIPFNLTVCAYHTSLYQTPDSSQQMMPLLMGARLVGHEKVGHWWKVTLPGGTSAAVRESDVLAGPALSPARLLLSRAMPFLGSPYFWGGCSPSLQHKGFIHSGVDCSGLVHLLYRTVGIAVPRDAHDQWLASVKVAAYEISSGDLIFSAPLSKPGRFDHVMIYVKDDTVLEASLTATLVRFVTLKEKIGCSLSEVCNGVQSDDVALAFGKVITGGEED